MAHHGIIATILLLALSAAAQTAHPTFTDEVGNFGVRRDARVWPLPETITRDLRSPDDRVRLGALDLVGLTDKQAHSATWGRTSPATVTGRKVVSPDQVTLTYASLGADATQYAILAVFLYESQLTFAAVAAPTPQGGWRRIATFDCWCKYEMVLAKDVLSEFVSLQLAPVWTSPGPQRFELVLRASGGGTGIYVMNEAHFRVFNGELRRVMDFVSRSRSCVQTGPPPRTCTLQVGWFVPASVDGRSARVLVQGQGQYFAGKMADAEHNAPGLENRSLRSRTCRTYVWNDSAFRYEPGSAASPCTAQAAEVGHVP